MSRLPVNIAIVTCDRTPFGKTDTFSETWASFLRSTAGAPPLGEIAIFDAGPGAERAERLSKETGYRVFGAPPGIRFCAATNFRRAIGQLAYFEWMTGWGILLPDDVRFCLNWSWRAYDFARTFDEEEGETLIALCAEYELSENPECQKRGWYLLSPKDFYGGIGLMARSSTWIDFAVSPEMRDCEVRGKGVDLAIAAYAAREHIPILASAPNLMEHTGQTESVLGHVHSHRPQFYPGDHFNAVRLPELRR